MTSGKIIVIGSSNTDMTVLTERIPIPGETILGGEFKMGPGGKGANQAVAAKRLGGDVSFICKVGNDIFGDNAIAHYKKEGLDVSNIQRSQKPSGVALICVDMKAENSIVVASGANNDFTVEDIDSLLPIISQAQIVLLQLEIPIPAVMRAAQLASQSGAYVVLNPAPAAELPEEIFKYISLIIPNQSEIALMTGIEAGDEEAAKLAVKKLREMGVKDVILTMGSHGSLIFRGESFTRIHAHKVNAVDTTAAGDTFCGALCVKLAQGANLVDAAMFANSAAALTVQRMGAQESIPYINEVEQ